MTARYYNIYPTLERLNQHTYTCGLNCFVNIAVAPIS